jgi:hypothetical protein
MRFGRASVLLSLLVACSSPRGAEHPSSAPHSEAAAKSSSDVAAKPKPKSNSPARPKAPLKDGVVRGVVMDTYTKKPLKGVTIILLAQNATSGYKTDCKEGGDPRCSAISKDSGRFALPVPVSGKRTMVFLYSDITVEWTGTLCRGRTTDLKIPINTSTAGGSVVKIQGPKTSCPASAGTTAAAGKCPHKPGIDPTGVPGRNQLSTAAHQRPTLAQVSAQLPALLTNYLAATVRATKQRSLAPFVGSVSGCTTMADMITWFYRKRHFSSLSSSTENAAPNLPVVLALILRSLKPIAVRFNKKDRRAVDVFLSKDRNARAVPTGKIAGLSRKQEMALLVTRQNGKLVLAGVSKPLMNYVVSEWRRVLH